MGFVSQTLISFVTDPTAGYEQRGSLLLTGITCGKVQFARVPRRRLVSLDRGRCNPTDMPPRKEWFPKDDIRFLKLLPDRFPGSYFKTSLVKERGVATW